MDILMYVYMGGAVVMLALIILLLSLRKRATVSMSSKQLLLGMALGLFILLTAFVVVYFLKNNIIFIGALILSSLVIFLFTLSFIKHQKQEVLEETEKLHKMESEHKRLLETPNEQVEKMKQIMPIGQSLLEETVQIVKVADDAFTAVTEIITRTVSKELDADGTVLLVLDDFEDILGVKSLFGDFPPPYKLPADVPLKKDRVMTNFKYAEFPLKDNIFAEAIKKADCFTINEPESNPSVITNGDEKFLKHGPLMFAPIIINGRIIGLLATSRAYGRESFTNFDSDIMKLLADYAGTALSLEQGLRENKEIDSITTTKDLAADIQKTLLPKKIKRIGNLELDVFFKQSHGVCSDFYDVIQNQKDRIFLITADVAGKSIQSCIIMSMIRALLYLVTNTRQSTVAILDWLNKGITGKIEIDHFASISLVVYFPQENCIEFIGAGNQSMLVLKKSTKKVEIYQHNTDPIGVDVNSIYKSTRIAVEDGDVFAMYTDGIIEALDEEGNQFGIKALAKVLIDNISLPSKDITKAVRDNIKRFMGKNLAHDDQTILVVKPGKR